MASLHRNSGKSRFWSASFAGPDKKQIHFSTKHEDKKLAQEVADLIEKAARMARTGLLTPEKVQSILDLLPPVDPDVRQKIREYLNRFLRFAGAEAISETTTRAWCQAWLTDQEGATAPGTLQRYTALINEFLKGLGEKADRSIRLISTFDVQTFRDKMVKQGVSDSSANLALKTLRTCLGGAVDQGYSTYNRAKALKLRSKGTRIRNFKKPFTNAQVNALIAHAPSREWRELIVAGYYIGDRLGNLAKLRLDDFNREKAILEYVPGKLKSGSAPKTVTVPMHPVIIDMIAAHDRTTGPLFPTLSKKSISGVGGLSLLFRKIMDAAGIKCEAQKPAGPRGRTVYSLSFHALRRTFNSDLANSNVSQELRMKLIGQASCDVNDMYTSIEEETLREAINKLPHLKVNPNQKTEIPPQ